MAPFTVPVPGGPFFLCSGFSLSLLYRQESWGAGPFRSLLLLSSRCCPGRKRCGCNKSRFLRAVTAPADGQPAEWRGSERGLMELLLRQIGTKSEGLSLTRGVQPDTLCGRDQGPGGTGRQPSATVPPCPSRTCCGGLAGQPPPRPPDSHTFSRLATQGFCGKPP